MLVIKSQYRAITTRWLMVLIVAATITVALTSTALMQRDGIVSAGSLGKNAGRNSAGNKKYDRLFVQTKGEQPSRAREPRESRLTRARPFDGDLRKLPQTRPPLKWRPEREPPFRIPRILAETTPPKRPVQPEANVLTPAAPAPTPISSFDGLDFANWGAGHPPDDNGDVGPTYYIQTINTSIGIFNKTTGARVAAFSFNTFMSQGSFGNLCDTDNFGDPVVVYDTFEDRWLVTDFAFRVDGSGNVVNPPGSFQCLAVSKTADPVSGGWNFYSINTTGGLGDYPKFGVWPDGIYMSANMFDYSAAGSFQNVRVYAFNKMQMYAGAPAPQVVSFDVADNNEFTLLPSNSRLQTGTPPLGSPDYFAAVGEFLNAFGVYKFHVDWTRISLSSFTGPSLSTMAFWWEQYDRSGATTAPSPANALDTLYPRLMMQNQYTNIGGAESLWTSHTVGAGNPTSNLTSAQSAVRYYQVNVTGGTIAANTIQSFTSSPDTTIFRFMPSVAVDRAGDMAIGYSTSNSATNPAIKYAGRLATDPVNTLSQTEQTLIQGTGTQSGTCGGSSCVRWGDYSAMTIDPDGCTFWYTNEYYAATGLNDLTRIASFRFSTCTVVGSGGTISGTVSRASDSSPISGATVSLGVRTTTTNGSGVYTFSGLPAGTYPSISASNAGFNSSSANNIVVNDGVTSTQNFSLTAAAPSACLTDTSQLDFQTGAGTNVDLVTSAGDVSLLNAANLDQKNQSVTTSGFGFTSTNWAGQTFQPAVTGQLAKVDLNLFCSNCTGTTPNLTVSIRATSGSPAVPTGSDLAVATIPGFSSGSGGFFSANFASPATLTAGATYAVIIRAVANPSAGTYAYVCSCADAFGDPNSNPYANGQRVTSSNSGSSWTADTTTGGRDLGFKTYMQTGFSSGDLVSSLKDANPAVAANPTWTTLSWTASVPANTTLRFQAASSNSPNGPFSFIGPDGTATTFFTSSGASLSQFNGFRFLKYRAYLSTTNGAITPVLNDVTVCFDDTSAALRIDSVAPPAGRTSGGQQIKLTGAFAGLVTVSFGGSSASWSYTNGSGDTSAITVSTPAHAVGAVQIDLTPTAGSVYSKSNAFAYLPTVFTDDTITAQQTIVKAQHITELRQAVDAMRAVAGLSGAPWTDTSLSAGATVKAAHILDLRTYLDDAATRLGYATSPYNDSGLTTGFVIKRIHIEDLRQRIRTIAG